MIESSFKNCCRVITTTVPAVARPENRTGFNPNPANEIAGRIRFHLSRQQQSSNYLTVKWLLSEVLPLLEKQNIKFKLAIVGTVGQWMKRYSNDLFLRYEHLFVGEVEDITQF